MQAIAAIKNSRLVRYIQQKPDFFIAIAIAGLFPLLVWLTLVVAFGIQEGFTAFAMVVIGCVWFSSTSAPGSK